MKVALALVWTASLANASPASDLHAAIVKNDVAAAKPLVAFPLVVKNMVFDTRACTTAFGGTASVDEQQFPALIGCLNSLDLVTASLGYTCAPGIQVMFSTDQGQVTEIWALATNGSFSLSEVDVKRKLGLRSRMLHVDADPETKKIAGRELEKVTATSSFCISTKGRVEEFMVVRSNMVHYAKHLTAAAARWRFTPFMRKGRALRVCTAIEHEWTNPRFDPYAGKSIIGDGPSLRDLQ